MSELPPFLGAWGPTAIAAAAVLGVLFGLLIPLRTHRREIADRDTQIKTWHEAWRAADARADLLGEQNAKLLTLAETTVALVSALPRPEPRAKEPL